MSQDLRKICQDYLAAQIGTVEFLSKVQLPDRQRDMVQSLSKMPLPLQNLIGYDDLFADERPKPTSKVHDYWKNLRQLLVNQHGVHYQYTALQLSEQVQIWTRDNLSIVADEYDRVFATKSHDIASSLASLFHNDSSQWQQADGRFGLDWLLVTVTYDHLDDINLVPPSSLTEGHMSIPKQKKAPTPKTPEQKAVDYFNKLSRRMWPNERYGGAALRKLLTIRSYTDDATDPEDVRYSFVFHDAKAASAFYELMNGKSQPGGFSNHAEFGFTLEELDEKELVPPDSACAWIKAKPKAKAKGK